MNNIEHRTSNVQHRKMAVRSAFSVQRSMFDVPKTVLIFLIRLYQLTVPPARLVLFGPAAGCRFTPSCSQYAMQAVREHGAVAGSSLAVKRICRCHPLGTAGHDPVPVKTDRICYHG